MGTFESQSEREQESLEFFHRTMSLFQSPEVAHETLGFDTPELRSPQCALESYRLV